MDFLEKFKIFLGDRVPNVLFEILKRTGYDSSIAVKQINTHGLNELESFLSSSDQHFENSIYTPFKQLLPGHRTSLLSLPSLVDEYELHIEQYKKMKQHLPDIAQTDSHYTFIMKELIKTAKDNGDRGPHQRRFSQPLQNFGMLLYMMCGKVSYEIICNNIPLPQASTMCKLNIFIFIYINPDLFFFII